MICLNTLAVALLATSAALAAPIPGHDDDAGDIQLRAASNLASHDTAARDVIVSRDVEGEERSRDLAALVARHLEDSGANELAARDVQQLQKRDGKVEESSLIRRAGGRGGGGSGGGVTRQTGSGGGGTRQTGRGGDGGHAVKPGAKYGDQYIRPAKQYEAAGRQGNPAYGKSQRKEIMKENGEIRGLQRQQGKADKQYATDKNKGAYQKTTGGIRKEINKEGNEVYGLTHHGKGAGGGK